MKKAIICFLIFTCLVGCSFSAPNHSKKKNIRTVCFLDKDDMYINKPIYDEEENVMYLKRRYDISIMYEKNVTPKLYDANTSTYEVMPLSLSSPVSIYYDDIEKVMYIAVYNGITYMVKSTNQVKTYDAETSIYSEISKPLSLMTEAKFYLDKNQDVIYLCLNNGISVMLNQDGFPKSSSSNNNFYYLNDLNELEDGIILIDTSTNFMYLKHKNGITAMVSSDGKSLKYQDSFKELYSGLEFQNMNSENIIPDEENNVLYYVDNNCMTILYDFNGKTRSK